MSSHFPQMNGAAKSGVEIAERLLQQLDIFLALMAYYSKPISAIKASPAELIMGRKLRIVLPSHQG